MMFSTWLTPLVDDKYPTAASATNPARRAPGSATAPAAAGHSTAATSAASGCSAAAARGAARCSQCTDRASAARSACYAACGSSRDAPQPDTNVGRAAGGRNVGIQTSARCPARGSTAQIWAVIARYTNKRASSATAAGAPSGCINCRTAARTSRAAGAEEPTSATCAAGAG